MSTPSRATEDSREAARQKTGEFGPQNHAESGIVEQPQRSNAQSYFNELRWAFCGDDPDRVRAWAGHDGATTRRVRTHNIEMAMFTLGRAGFDEMDASSELPEAERWALADEYLGKVWAEAARRQAAELEFDRRRANRAFPSTRASAHRVLISNMADVVELGLLPPGTTVTAFMSGRVENPYTFVRLEGMTDRQAREACIDDDDAAGPAFSPYGHAVHAFLSRVAADTETSLTGKRAWPQVQIETGSARILRIRNDEKAAGTRFAAAVAEGGDSSSALSALRTATALADETRQS